METRSVLCAAALLLALGLAAGSRTREDPSPEAATSSPSLLTRWVSSDGLMVREAPSTSSPRRNVIPHGSAIEVSLTRSVLELDGVRKPWFHVPALDGYVAGHFLDERADLEDKPYSLLRYSGDPSYGAVALLSLQRGKADYRLTWDGEGAGGVVSHAGTYELLPAGIDVHLKAGTSTTSDYAGERRESAAALVLELRYVEQRRGFVEASMLASPPRGRPDRARCAWLAPEPCMGETGLRCEVVTGWWCVD